MRTEEAEAVHAVHLYRSFMSAADALAIPVSTLSKRVTHVEKELGVRLFERNSSTNSVTPTAQSKALLPLIGRLVSLHNALLEKTDEVENGGATKIIVGQTLLLTDDFANEAISQFLALHPHAEVVMVKRSQLEVLRMLQEGVVDCGIVTLVGSETENIAVLDTFVSDQFDFELLESSSGVWVGVASDDPLASKKALRPEDFRHRGIIFNKWHGEKEGKEGKQYSFFDFLGIDDTDYVVYKEDFINRDYIYKLVARGVGVLPQAFRPTKEVPGITFVPLEGWPVQSQIFLLARKQVPEPVQDFRKVFKSMKTL